jgi:hypothetical protein
MKSVYSDPWIREFAFQRLNVHVIFPMKGSTDTLA